MRWFLVPLAVTASVSDEGSKKKSLRGGPQTGLGEGHNDNHPGLITDEHEDEKATGTDVEVKKHGPPHVPRDEPRSTFEKVGDGNCLNEHSVRIMGTPVFLETQIGPNGEADECDDYCRRSSQCAGYISMKKEKQCQVIVASNNNYSGGISGTDDADGVICFKKTGIPVMREHSNGWETFGSRKLNDDGSEKNSSADHGGYDPFTSTKAPPPPHPDNLTAKIIFSIIIIGSALVGFVLYMALYA